MRGTRRCAGKHSPTLPGDGPPRHPHRFAGAQLLPTGGVFSPATAGHHPAPDLGSCASHPAHCSLERR
jgi:hypothetical protein